jgi:hypothetical protein
VKRAWASPGLLAALLAAQAGLAQSPASPTPVSRLTDRQVEELWQRHFPGRPFIPMTIRDTARLLRFDPPAREGACMPLVLELLDALDAYGRAAAGGQEPEIAPIRARLDTAGGCRAWVGRAYLLGSLDLMNLPSYVPEITFFGDTQGRRLPTTVYPLLTVAAFANGGRIAFADENDDYYSLHDCRETRMAVDLSLKPYNLASALGHELFHIYYDKAKGALDPDLRVFSSEFRHRDPERDGVNWKVALLMEEAFALVHTGIEQILMSRVPARFGAPAAYRLRGDLDMVLPDGPLVRMIELVGPELPEKVIGKTLATQRLGVNRPQGDARLEDPALEERVAPLRRRLYENVQAGYFKGDPLTPADWQLLDPGNHGSGSHLYSSLSQALPYFLQETDPGTRGVRFSDYVSPGLIRPAAEGTVIRVDLRHMTAVIAGLLELFRARTPYCEAFTRALGTPELQYYLGKGLPFPAMFGGEGVKSDGKGVKLGGEGAKPGGEGAKPCLRLKGRI